MDTTDVPISSFPDRNEMSRQPYLSSPKWWKEAIVYQIYPASFLDTNGDGWGDVRGITRKLDYLKDLGVDVLWLSPIYKSPQKDMGYDISDYEDIDPMYGTLRDVIDLIDIATRGYKMKIVMDLVVNHTSDQHAWFLESRSSKSSPKRDWYIWKPAKYDAEGNRQPPNNWAQILGEANSAWTWDEHTQEYFLSLFTPEQPDLNWENREVRLAVHQILRFWLDKGVSGFRMDVINLISKHQDFPDAEVVVPAHKYQPGDKFFANGPRLHEFLGQIREKVLSQYDTLTVGEMPFVRDEDEIIRVVGEKEGSLNMIFSFDIVDIDNVPGDFKYTLHKWDARDLKRIITRLQRLMLDRNGWNTIFIENHDQPRSVSRYTDDSDEFRVYGAKLLAMMQISLAGTLFVYQGEELGMRNVPPEWGIEEYKDVESINFYKKYNEMYPNNSEKLAEARHILQRKARDNARTPVQWTPKPHAGFTDPESTPWMRVNDDYKTVNAQAQRYDENSVLTFWKRLLRFRKNWKETLVYGDYEVLDPDNDKVVAWKRLGKDAFLFVGNFSGEEVEWTGHVSNVRRWIFSNYAGSMPETKCEKLTLRPWESLLAEL